jgi:hypothetical protein
MSDLLKTHFRRVKAMAWEIEQPESMTGGGGNFVDKPGLYHMIVTEVDEKPEGKKGESLDGLRVTLAVLEGEQKDRSIELMFWKPTEKDGMASKKLTAFCLATSLIGAHIPGQRTTVEPSEAVGRQVCCKLTWKQKKNEQTGKYEDSTDRVDLHYSDIWHIDDMNVAKNGIKLCQDALAMIPPALRKPLTQPKVSPAALVNGTRSESSAVSLSDL